MSIIHVAGLSLLTWKQHNTTQQRQHKGSTVLMTWMGSKVQTDE